MRNLKKANIAPKALLNKVIASKKGVNKTRMEGMRVDLETRYDEYSVKADNNTLHSLVERWHYDKNDSTTDGYFLYGQYDNSKKSMSDLQAKIIEANNGEIVLKCPICELRDAKDMDHYVPRQLFPEFSVNAYNLIPTCHDCNNLKSTSWCEQGHRLIFNAYYDTPTDEFLFNVTLKKEDGLLRIILALKHFSNPKEETRIALSTINSLDLMPYVNQRINEKINSKLKEIIRRRKHFKGNDEDYLRMEKDTLTDSIEEIADVNNWNRIVLVALRDENIVEEWLREQFSK